MINEVCTFVSHQDDFGFFFTAGKIQTIHTYVDIYICTFWLRQVPKVSRCCLCVCDNQIMSSSSILKSPGAYRVGKQASKLKRAQERELKRELKRGSSREETQERAQERKLKRELKRGSSRESSKES